VAEIKPGYRTTEFRITGISGLPTTIIEVIAGGGLPLPPWAGPVLMAIYGISRGLAKLTKQ